jgi:hypothetical protein
VIYISRHTLGRVFPKMGLCAHCPPAVHVSDVTNFLDLFFFFILSLPLFFFFFSLFPFKPFITSSCAFESSTERYPLHSSDLLIPSFFQLPSNSNIQHTYTTTNSPLSSYNITRHSLEFTLLWSPFDSLLLYSPLFTLHFSPLTSLLTHSTISL